MENARINSRETLSVKSFVHRTQIMLAGMILAPVYSIHKLGRRAVDRTNRWQGIGCCVVLLVNENQGDTSQGLRGANSLNVISWHANTLLSEHSIPPAGWEAAHLQ